MDAIDSSKIVMYSTGWCPDCHRAKRVFARLEKEYVDIDIEQHPEAVAAVLAANDGKKSVPTIIFPDGSVLVEPSNQALTDKLNSAEA